MSFPRYPGKWSKPGICQPGDLLRYLNRDKQETWPGFKTALLLYPTSPLQKFKAEADFSQASWLGLNFHWLNDGATAVVTGLGFGAPALAMKAEELIALGVKRLILIGTAGALEASSQPGDVVVAERAIRDEGLSYHYLPPEEFVEGDPELTDRVARILAGAEVPSRRATTWTTDAVYRETAEECEAWSAQGVACVEMEAAALFAVARYRGVEAAAALVISDRVVAQGWQPFLRDVRVKNSLLKTLISLFKNL